MREFRSQDAIHGFLIQVDQQPIFQHHGGMENSPQRWQGFIDLPGDNRSMLSPASSWLTPRRLLMASVAGMDTIVRRDRLGTARLGMTGAALKSATPTARDSGNQNTEKP